MQGEHERFMAAALKEAQRARDLGNAACGAVIVRDGEVLSTGYNEVISTFDITAHAEAAAIRKLTMTRRQLNPGSQADSGPFAGAILYSTLEPCPMCCWLTCIVGVSTLVIGARHADLDILIGVAGPRTARGGGRLLTNQGSGTWAGVGPSGRCSGVWNATRY